MEVDTQSVEKNFYPQGFVFDNCARNQAFQDKLKFQCAFKKTGTTIVGLVYKDGVIIAADQRATTESLIVDKGCLKIHYIAPNIYCCGAGTAADADEITNLISQQLALMRLQTGKQSRLAAAQTLLSERLFQYGGNISAALILGGCDINGPQLYGIWPNGR
ncbi:hypothetical protein WA538_000991 [Blastocystis sp. DL]